MEEQATQQLGILVHREKVGLEAAEERVYHELVAPPQQDSEVGDLERARLTHLLRAYRASTEGVKLTPLA